MHHKRLLHKSFKEVLASGWLVETEGQLSSKAFQLGALSFLQCSVLPLDGPSSMGIVVCCYWRMDLNYQLKLGSDGIKGPERVQRVCSH